MVRVWRILGTTVAMGLFARAGYAAPVPAPLAYEDFAYMPSGVPLSGRNGGSGFAIPWNGDPGIVVQAPNLKSGLGLVSNGFSITHQIGSGGDISRTLTTPLNQPVFWVSFMIQATAGNDQVFLGLDVAPSSTPLIAFGRRVLGPGVYFIQSGTHPPAILPGVSPSGVTDLLVARITNGSPSSAATVDLWVNKDPTTSPPSLSQIVGVLPPLGVVNIHVQSGLLLDEVRIGLLPTDVAAAPNPVPIPRWSIWGLYFALAITAGVLIRVRRMSRHMSSAAA